MFWELVHSQGGVNYERRVKKKDFALNDSKPKF